MMLARCYWSSIIKRSCSTTALNNFHLKYKGKLVNFAGFSLPVQYTDQSIAASHVHTRRHASLFDVSHMLQTEIEGSNCVPFIESLCTADVGRLDIGRATLSVFTHEHGGILDDLIITKTDNQRLLLVTNAARRDHDMGLLMNAIKSFSSSTVRLKFFEPTERSLLALQGPAAAECLRNISNINIERLYFMHSTVGTVAGIECCRVTRCGYTGEDGFELSVPSVVVEELAEELLKDERVRLAGLGARDTLRTEAGLCLYGSDIDENTTPIEAGLTWLIAKSRRQRADFPGSFIINDQIKNGTTKKRIGLISKSPAPPARHGTLLFDPSVSTTEHIGVVTSGCPSPTLNFNVAMAYIPNYLTKSGTEILYKIREKLFPAVVTKMPFIKTNYFMPSK